MEQAGGEVQRVVGQSVNESILDKVRQSTKFVAENASDVKINSEAVAKFCDTLDADEFADKVAPGGYPLRFDTLSDEVSFWAILDLLNFGSGFRLPLHAARQQGAFETIQRGLMGMYLSGSPLDTKFLQTISLGQVGEFFNIPLFEERDIHGGAIFMSVPGPLHPLGKMITDVLNEAGNILAKEGCTGGLGEWILKASSESHGLASALVEKLVATFPGFADKALFKGREVFILKKAQLLVADLYRQLRVKEPAFNFVDIHSLTVFSDNVLPAVLRKLGILELSVSLAADIDQKKELPPGEEEVQLRCVAIQACEQIVTEYAQRTSSAAKAIPMTPMTLDYYLWKKGKDPEFRSIERHYTKETFYY